MEGAWTTEGVFSIDQEVAALVRSLFPGARSVSVRRLGVDATGGRGETLKATGYGEPLLVVIRDARGGLHELVLHAPTENDFGHDRRADRADEALLAFDTFARIPRHVEAIDVGAIASDGSLISLRDAHEFYLITRYAAGRVYAEDLRSIAREGVARAADVARVEALARYLVTLHAERGERAAAYRRAVRDLIGHGECIFGVVDNYPPSTPAAPRARLEAIERACLEWRFRLRDRVDRLRRTHGDFHPFNILFQEGLEFRVLDASRGSEGDPADDLAALAINFPFFALERPASWAGALRALWNRFFEVYLDGSGDRELLDVIPPFLAFRGLVVASPVFYPSLAPGDRDRLLGFVEAVLAAPRFDPSMGDAMFR
jgi:hypothetical protein